MSVVTATANGVLRALHPRDVPSLRALTDRDPVAHCLVAGRVEAHGLDPWHLGGEVWGWYEGSELVSALFAGPNVVPVAAVPTAIDAFADRLRRSGRLCSSLVGPADEVLALWDRLSTSWGRAREVRANQPLMVIDKPPAAQADPLVRQVRPDEVETLMPACVAMFTEEVGVSPYAGGSERAYRNRVSELVSTGRSFARIEDGRVIFKAEIGSSSRDVCQVQGVWVDPEFRGRGLSVSGMATVVELAARQIAPRVSLYVNDYNVAARAAYRRVGFVEVGTFATVLF
jgi:predicted GNAT family acetyltransferase